MEAKQLNNYTTDFIEKLPEGQRAELADGYIYMMSSPSRTHQKIIKNITFDIENHIRKNKKYLIDFKKSIQILIVKLAICTVNKKL